MSVVPRQNAAQPEWPVKSETLKKLIRANQAINVTFC
jgi:hypothetical protein